MFNTMNENEMMNVNGGFYYVPAYDKKGNYLGLTQIESSDPKVKKVVNGVRYYY